MECLGEVWRCIKKAWQSWGRGLGFRASTPSYSRKGMHCLGRSQMSAVESPSYAWDTEHPSA